MRGRGPVRNAEWVIGAVAGIVAGIVAGTALAVAVQDWQQDREDADVAHRAEVFGRQDVPPPPGDAVRALAEQDSLVAVDPLLADRIPEEDRARAEQILAGSPVPARIAYLAYPDSSDVGYTPDGAAVQWQTAVGEEGHYVVLWDNGSTDAGALGLEEHYVDTRTNGQPGPALVRVAEEMAMWQAEPLATEPEPPNDSDEYWGGVTGGIAVGGVVGAVGVVPAFLLLRWYVGSRRRKAT